MITFPATTSFPFEVLHVEFDTVSTPKVDTLILHNCTIDGNIQVEQLFVNSKRFQIHNNVVSRRWAHHRSVLIVFKNDFHQDCGVVIVRP